jgi:hypothetical protein
MSSLIAFPWVPDTTNEEKTTSFKWTHDGVRHEFNANILNSRTRNHCESHRTSNIFHACWNQSNHRSVSASTTLLLQLPPPRIENRFISGVVSKRRRYCRNLSMDRHRVHMRCSDGDRYDIFCEGSSG